MARPALRTRIAQGKPRRSGGLPLPGYLARKAMRAAPQERGDSDDAQDYGKRQVQQVPREGNYIAFYTRGKSMKALVLAITGGVATSLATLTLLRLAQGNPKWTQFNNETNALIGAFIGILGIISWYLAAKEITGE